VVRPLRRERLLLLAERAIAPRARSPRPFAQLLRYGRPAAHAAVARGTGLPRVAIAEVAQEVLAPAAGRVGEAHHAIEHLPLADHALRSQLEGHRELGGTHLRRQHGEVAGVAHGAPALEMARALELLAGGLHLGWVEREPVRQHLHSALSQTAGLVPDPA